VRAPAAAAPSATALPLAFALLLAASAPASAQLGRKSWEFFPHVGALAPGRPDALPAAAGDLDPGVLWGFYATYHYTDHVGVELGFSKATANGPEAEEGPLGDVGLDFWELNGFVNSGALRILQLFATGGVGLVNYDPEAAGGPTRLLLNGGLGIRWYSWKNIAVRLEVKDFVFPGAEAADYTGPGGVSCPAPCPSPAPGPVETDGETVHNLGALAGLTFNF
jgi:hypothetical protein